MPSGKKFSAAKIKGLKIDFLQALSKSLGITTLAAKNSGVRYDLYLKWRKEDDEFDYACERIQDESIDFVESRLYKLIQEGDRTAIIFFLKCRRPDKWNDRAGQQLNINISGTEFQIGGGNAGPSNLFITDTDMKQLEENNDDN